MMDACRLTIIATPINPAVNWYMERFDYAVAIATQRITLAKTHAVNQHNS